MGRKNRRKPSDSERKVSASWRDLVQAEAKRTGQKWEKIFYDAARWWRKSGNELLEKRHEEHCAAYKRSRSQPVSERQIPDYVRAFINMRHKARVGSAIAVRRRSWRES